MQDMSMDWAYKTTGRLLQGLPPQSIFFELTGANASFTRHCAPLIISGHHTAIGYDRDPETCPIHRTAESTVEGLRGFYKSLGNGSQAVLDVRRGREIGRAHV